MKSSIMDKIFNEVCLDERVSDGIFRMDEEEHMNALRDYFIKKGITKEAAISVTNRMVEGNYPDRQAYRKEDGILVTWPSAQHMAKAFKENPGKYVTQDPFPERRKKKEPEPKEPIPKEKPKDEKDEKDVEGDKEEPLPKSSGGGGSNLFDKEPKIQQGDKELEIEPPRGEETPTPPPASTSPTVSLLPRTPERVAAEKEVTKQIMKTDDTSLTQIIPNNLSETCRHQLTELYKKADELGFKEAITFLTKYVKP